MGRTIERGLQVIAICGCCVSGVVAQESGDAEVDPLIAAMIKSRDVIKAMEYTIHIERGACEIEQLKDATIDYTCWWSPEQWRVDIEEERTSSPENAARSKTVRTKAFIREAGHPMPKLIWNELKLPGDYVTGGMGSYFDEQEPDPRLQGLRIFPFEVGSPLGLRHISPIVFDNPDAGAASPFPRGELLGKWRGGKRSYDVVMRIHPDSELPEFTRVLELNGPSTETTLSTSWERHAGSGVWFPRESRYEKRKSGVSKWLETLTMEVHSVNAPIDESVFTWESLGIQDGRVVQFRTNSREEGEFLEWRSGRFVPHQFQPLVDPNFTAVAESKTPSPGATVRGGILTASIAVVLLGLVVLILRVIRLRPVE
jgi:hypothetical protein